MRKPEGSQIVFGFGRLAPCVENEEVLLDECNRDVSSIQTAPMAFLFADNARIEREEFL
jgi:hypothetical protein